MAADIMRLDRSITLGIVQPFRKMVRRGPSSPPAILPVLMYHSISHGDEAGVSGYFKVCTSPARFAEQMSGLRRLGWQGVTLAEGLRRLSNAAANREDQPLKCVAITFDDGFRDFHTEAYPVLQENRFSATMYLPTGYIAQDRRRFKNRECLTWPEVRELRKAGIQFGSHTVHHPKLVELGEAEIAAELSDSKAAIEHELGEAIDSFAYPYAFPQTATAFVRKFHELLVQTGYRTCATTVLGRVTINTEPFVLPRLPANSDDDGALLSAKLAGAYDWMALPQRIRKLIAPSNFASGSHAQQAERSAS